MCAIYNVMEGWWACNTGAHVVPCEKKMEQHMIHLQTPISYTILSIFPSCSSAEDPGRKIY